MKLFTREPRPRPKYRVGDAVYVTAEFLSGWRMLKGEPGIVTSRRKRAGQVIYTVRLSGRIALTCEVLEHELDSTHRG